MSFKACVVSLMYMFGFGISAQGKLIIHSSGSWLLVGQILILLDDNHQDCYCLPLKKQ